MWERCAAWTHRETLQKLTPAAFDPYSLQLQWHRSEELLTSQGLGEVRER